MELCAGWLERALEVLRTQPDVAVVTGLTVDVWPATKASDRAEAGVPPECSTGQIEVPYIAGAGLYRRQALEQVGSFNPYLYSDEEPELCIRIRQAGYRIVQLDTPIAYHYSTPSEALSTLVNRWRRNLYLGAGQCLRYHFGTKTFWSYLRERGYGCAPGIGLGAGILSLGWSFQSQRWLWFQLWLLLFVALVVVDTYRKQSLSLTVASLLKRLFIVDGTVRGFLLKPLAPESYPEKLDVIKQVS
jgi:hypothetical protein